MEMALREARARLSELVIAASRGERAATVIEMPPCHRDPFDELLCVQVQKEGLRLLAVDRFPGGHPLAVSSEGTRP